MFNLPKPEIVDFDDPLQMKKKTKSRMQAELENCIVALQLARKMIVLPDGGSDMWDDLQSIDITIDQAKDYINGLNDRPDGK